MRIATLISLAALLALAACQEGTVGPMQQTDAATPSFAKKGEPNPVPFKVRLTVTPDPPIPPPEGCELFFTTSVAGNATHLGRITGTGATCAFNLQFGVLDPPFIPDGSAPPFLVADFTNEMAWTAANGDVLFFRVFDPPATIVQSLTDGTSRAEGIGEFTGGTGRFQGATGEVQAVAVGDQFSAEGWIQYDASNRAN